MELYDETCFETSKLITKKYSTSFSKGIAAFHPRFRYPIYSIYGFVRFADEIVDTFRTQDKQKLLDNFEKEAFSAIEKKISLNPVLQSFQITVNHYQIDRELISCFLKSMRMDIGKATFTEAEYKRYIHGSAEVIGLMCLRVFCEGDNERYDSLVPSAKSLGSALQKVNFLRDIKADQHERSRAYFPNVTFGTFDNTSKKLIETDIKRDFDDGFKGIKALPDGARLGVYIAYQYYLSLFKKIVKTPAETILQKRMRVSNSSKAFLYYKAVLRHKLGLI
jgi:phytoene/squalene synthetase